MKSPKLLSLLIVSLFLFAFQCDSDEIPVYLLDTENLAGTYVVTEFSGTTTETDTDGVTIDVLTSRFTATDFQNATITFTSNGNVSSTGSYTLNVVETDNGVNNTYTENDDLDINGSYTLNGNTIILPDVDGATTTIRNFSENGLQLVLQELVTDTDYRYEAQATFTLERQ